MKAELARLTLEEIHNLMCQTVQAASEEKKLELIRAHPGIYICCVFSIFQRIINFFSLQISLGVLLRQVL